MQRGKSFSGIRPLVRKHVKEEHRIRGGKIYLKDKKHVGKITSNIIVAEYEDENTNRFI